MITDVRRGAEEDGVEPDVEVADGGSTAAEEDEEGGRLAEEVGDASEIPLALSEGMGREMVRGCEEEEEEVWEEEVWPWRRATEGWGKGLGWRARKGGEPGAVVVLDEEFDGGPLSISPSSDCLLFLQTSTSTKTTDSYIYNNIVIQPDTILLPNL